jgi:hypothetical protein
VEFFHHKQPSSDSLGLKKPLCIPLAHLLAGGEEEEEKSGTLGYRLAYVSFDGTNISW